MNQQTKSESKKSTGRRNGGPYASTNIDISSGNKSGAKTLILTEYDETLDIKDEIIQDQERHQNGEHNLLFQRNQLNEKNITSENNSTVKILIKCEIDETFEIKQETIQDQERHLNGEHNLLFGANQLDEKCVISDNNVSGTKSLIGCDFDETLKVKEEIMQEQETVASHKITIKYKLKFCTVDIWESDILSVNKWQQQKEQKIQKSRQKPDKKYKCGKCARRYKYKEDLNKHKKYECESMPQFRCEFCDKQFKRKDSLKRHLVHVHRKIISYKKRQKIQKIQKAIRGPGKHKCGKCTRCYQQKKDLNRHQKYECGVMPQFRCEYCDRKFKRKSHLKSHDDHVHRKTNSNAS